MLWHGLPTMPFARPKVSRVPARSRETFGPGMWLGRETGHNVREGHSRQAGKPDLLIKS